MRTFYRGAISLRMCAAFVVLAGIAGCGGHGYYRTYDPDYHDYHVWNNNEVVYYNRWETETHRDHKEFQDRDDKDKNEYWNWRHNQSQDHR
jgi:hypothetical protein